MVDVGYAETPCALLSSMARHSKRTAQILRVLNVAKYLERIADHATNVAETVFWLAQGSDVRPAPAKMFEGGTAS